MKLLVLFLCCFAWTFADKITLTGTVRDFKAYWEAGGHPDFESFCCGVATGMVSSTLGADHTPVYQSSQGFLTGAAAFNEWFHDGPRSLVTTTTLELSNENSGNPNVYSYYNGEFFPIDGQLYGNYALGHNYHFTMEVHTEFTYQGGEVFSFCGDDDVWVFINNQIVTDLGGVHGQACSNVNVDSLGLTAGQAYPFDLFFAERHTSGSNFKMETSIRLQENPICEEDGTYRTQSEGDWGDKCSEGFASGCFRDANFDRCFPDGLQLGCECVNPQKRTVCSGNTLTFTSSSTVEGYLPQLGRPGPLDHSYVDPVNNNNPVSTSSGNFGGQLTALGVSIGFDNCLSDFGSDCGALQDLFICDTRQNECERTGNKRTGCHKRTAYNPDDGKPEFANCRAYYGWTVNQVFEAANKALGGCCDHSSEDPSCNPVMLNECVTFINQAFIFGKTLSEIPAGIFSESQCPLSEAGCSDGQREGFLDQQRFPCIAACSSSWSEPGVVGKAKVCGGLAGDDFDTNPVRCSVADACAAGWHVCSTSADVASRLADGSCNDAGQGFYVTQQTGGGCGVCATGSTPCAPGTCSSQCAFDANMRNDLFGCGTSGATPDGSCAPLNKFGSNFCGALSSPTWECGPGNTNTNGFFEANVAVKNNNNGGGVLCCKDTCS